MRDCWHSCLHHTRQRGHVRYGWPLSSPCGPHSLCWCPCISILCACIWVIVWSPHSFNPLICWTLEITAVICQLGQSGPQGSTHVHARALTHTMTVTSACLISAKQDTFQSNKNWCSSVRGWVLHWNVHKNVRSTKAEENRELPERDSHSHIYM